MDDAVPYGVLMKHLYVCPCCRKRVVAAMSPSGARRATGRVLHCSECHVVMVYKGRDDSKAD